MMVPVDGSGQISGMRRIPKQERSRKRVEAMVDAAERLIGEHGYDALTTTQIAEAAGVTVATLYQFFPDKRAVTQRVVERLLDQFVDEVARQPDAEPDSPWWNDIERTWRVIAHFKKRSPAFAQVEFGDSIDLHLLDENLTNSEVVTARISLNHGGEQPMEDPAMRQVMTIVATAVTPLYALAFKDDPDGDPVILEEIATMVRSYITAKFGEPPAG